MSLPPAKDPTNPSAEQIDAGRSPNLRRPGAAGHPATKPTIAKSHLTAPSLITHPLGPHILRAIATVRDPRNHPRRPVRSTQLPNEAAGSGRAWLCRGPLLVRQAVQQQWVDGRSQDGKRPERGREDDPRAVARVRAEESRSQGPCSTTRMKLHSFSDGEPSLGRGTGAFCTIFWLCLPGSESLSHCPKKPVKPPLPGPLS